MAYDKTNTGGLWKNQKRKTDTHPEYTGSINIEGKEYWLSAWVKDHAKGKYFSLSAKPKEAMGKIESTEPATRALQDEATRQSRSPASTPEFDDDIPF